MDNQKASKEKLQVTMFGYFAIVWQGENITAGVKTSDSHFARLMQILLHNRETGISRTELQELLFSDSKAEDVHHLLRTDLYNARVRLRQAGLPKSKYIIYSKGRYSWDSSIEVEDDTQRFEELCANAAGEQDAEKKRRLLLEACYSYKGEFLPMQADLIWVAQEQNRYREMFLECVEETACILRERKEFRELEELGRHASIVCPLRDLEVLIAEPLVAMGRFNEAYEIYEETIDRYRSELGISGAEGLMSLMEKVISGVSRPTEILDMIQSQLEEEDEEGGGYLCSYPAFRSIYKMLQRTMSRSNRSAYLMVFTAGDAADPLKYSEEENESLVRELEQIICSSVRKSDIVCRYGRGQYLLILLSKTEEGVRIAGERIKRRLQKRLPSETITYQERPIEPVDENISSDNPGDPASKRI